ncbi:zinc knuckle CX2CX4HX4C containing protein [Tanacetum coccineum]
MRGRGDTVITNAAIKLLLYTSTLERARASFVDARNHYDRDGIDCEEFTDVVMRIGPQITIEFIFANHFHVGTMARVDVDTLTMEQFLAMSRENQAPGVVKPEIRGNVNYEIKSQFMHEFTQDTFCGRKDMGGQTSPRNYQYLGPPQKDIYPKVLPTFHDRKGIMTRHRNGIMTCYTSALPTTSTIIKRNIKSSSSNDGLAALANKLDNLGRDMKKLKESVHAIQTNNAFNGNNRGKFHVGSPEYYTKTDNHPLYGERRQNLEELLAKHQEESARRGTEMEEGKSEQVKVVNVEHEESSSTKNLKNLHGISFLSDSQEENTNDQLPTKESNPGHFTLPCTIGNFNFYAMADLGTSVNVLPRNIFEYLELTNLSETEMLVEMVYMRKKAPLGIVKDILVKIDKFLFPSDFVILDQTPNSTIILGRPFLATVHAQISVFEKEISVGIGDERVTFNIDRNDHNFAPTEGIFMLNSINTNEPITKRLKISDDTATKHFCKPIVQECDKDFKAWPSCSPLRNKCDGGHKIYGIDKLSKTKYWFFPNNSKEGNERRWGIISKLFNNKIWPRNYTFKEWVKLKKGHLDISKSVRKDLFRLWVIDKSTKALDPDKEPFGRCLDEYNWAFPKEIEQLADEYKIKIREKGQVLEEIWTKFKRARCKDKDWWYDYWYEDEEKTALGSEDYNPPMVHTETFEVTKYKFDNGYSFICVSGKNNETLSLGRKNRSRFRKMIMEEMEEVLGDDGEDSNDET